MLSASAFRKIGTLRSRVVVQRHGSWKLLKIGTPDNTSQSHHLVVPYPESAFKINKIYKEASTNQPFRIMTTPDKQYLEKKRGRRTPDLRQQGKKKSRQCEGFKI